MWYLPVDSRYKTCTVHDNGKIETEVTMTKVRRHDTVIAMEKKDGRSVSHEMLEQIRLQAVLRVLAGENPEETMRRLGLNRTCIYRWISIYKKEGAAGLRAKSISGRPPKIDPERMTDLTKKLSALHTGKFAPTAFVWNFNDVRELVSSEYNMGLSEKTIERMMIRSGIVSQNDMAPGAFFDHLAIQLQSVKRKARQTNRGIYVYAERIVETDVHEKKTIFLAIPERGDIFFMIHNDRPRACAMTGFIARFSERVKAEEKIAILAIDRSKYDLPLWASRHIASSCDAVKIEFLEDAYGAHSGTSLTPISEGLPE
jgi:transposase